MTNFSLAPTTIALPTREGRVDNHFGHCAYYTLFKVVSGVVVETTTMPSPEGCGCKSDIASRLAAAGVSIMLAGDMGDGAKRVLAAHNIAVIRGCSGQVEAVVADYLAGRVSDSGQMCDHHDCPSHH